MQSYTCLTASDKKYNPLVIKWLCKQFNHEGYPHSYKDQWIRWGIWNGDLKISLDLSVPEQKKLFDSISNRFKGTPQYQTLNIVNTDTLYFDLKDILYIAYPDIVGANVLETARRTDEDGDDYYVFTWEVCLSDGTSVVYTNQARRNFPSMDLKKGDFIYNKTIQERAFVQFLDKLFI